MFLGPNWMVLPLCDSLFKESVEGVNEHLSGLKACVLIRAG